MTYFNTNREVGETLAKSEKQVAKQDAIIRQFFEVNPHASFSSFQVLALVKWPTVPPPRTSVHRALRTLVVDGHIVKNGADEMVDGPYGKRVHTWRAAPIVPEQANLFTEMERRG